jgi:hypothetical protein
MTYDTRPRCVWGGNGALAPGAPSPSRSARPRSPSISYTTTSSAHPVACAEATAPAGQATIGHASTLFRPTTSLAVGSCSRSQLQRTCTSRSAPTEARTTTTEPERGTLAPTPPPHGTAAAHRCAEPPTRRRRGVESPSRRRPDLPRPAGSPTRSASQAAAARDSPCPEGRRETSGEPTGGADSEPPPTRQWERSGSFLQAAAVGVTGYEAKDA